MTKLRFVPTRFAAVLCLVSLTGLVACADSNRDRSGGATGSPVERVIGGGTKQMSDVQPVAGFLPAPGLLQVGGNGRAALFYRKADADLSAYRSIVLDPVEIWTSPGSDLSKAPVAQRRELANLFYSTLFTEMKKHCTMAAKPAAHSLRMKFALADAKLPNVAVNTVANYAPYYVSTAYSVTSRAFNKGVGFFAGTATVEGYAKDARTGEVLWQAVDKRGGTVAVVSNTLDKWLDVRHAFQAWSRQIVQGLQDSGICVR